MSVFECVLGVLLILLMLGDAFETIVLPRTVRRRVRLAQLVYRTTWGITRAASKGLRGGLREYLLSLYGPLFLIILIVIWAFGLITGFGLLQYGLNPHGLFVTTGSQNLGAALYMSATTFFTLGLGDVVPGSIETRVVAVIEAGTGFAFLALMIGYLPIFYTAFSRREVHVSMLDERAGSPPCASEMLRRNGPVATERFLILWETWAAELLETHISYPILAAFRSQHEGQSWLAALTMILDTCAVIMSGLEGFAHEQARFTFAISRHALIDLCQVFDARPIAATPLRLSRADFEMLRAGLASEGFEFANGSKVWDSLGELRTAYEPFAYALGERLLFDLPPWLSAGGAHDDWQTSPWDAMPPMAGWHE